MTYDKNYIFFFFYLVTYLFNDITFEMQSCVDNSIGFYHPDAKFCLNYEGTPSNSFLDTWLTILFQFLRLS